jgi:hypothetical protein
MIWLFSFYVLASSCCRYNSKFSCWNILTQKRKEQRQSTYRVPISSLPRKFRSLKILGPYKLTVYILLHCTAETESEVAEKSSWDQANRGEKLGLDWTNRKKISQIINDCLYLPFFLLIILCCIQREMWGMAPYMLELTINSPYLIVNSALQRKSHLFIPFLGIARLQFQFPHSCVCERYSLTGWVHIFFCRRK